jgi:hypothetical protein
MKIHLLWFTAMSLLASDKVPDEKNATMFKRPTNGQEMMICKDALQDAKDHYFAQAARAHRACKESTECVLWRSNPVNLKGVGPLQNCYTHWENAFPMCIPPGGTGGVIMNLPGRAGPHRPNYALCQEGQCVAVFGPAPRNWKLDYRKAMIDAMDPAVPNAPDPDCLKGIPPPHRLDPSRVRRRFDSPL